MKIVFFKIRVKAKALLAPTTTYKRRLVAVRDLARDCVLLKAYFIDRFENSRVFDDVCRWQTTRSELNH